MMVACWNVAVLFDHSSNESKGKEISASFQILGDSVGGLTYDLTGISIHDCSGNFKVHFSKYNSYPYYEF